MPHLLGFWKIQKGKKGGRGGRREGGAEARGQEGLGGVVCEINLVGSRQQLHHMIHRRFHMIHEDFVSAHQNDEG
jgi:hypothetical protein